MGKSTPKTPAAPDPTAVSNAQTASNQQTALYNYGLNNPTVNTPLGSSSFNVGSSTPTYDYDAFNKATAAYNAEPTTTSAAAMTPQQQAAYKQAGATYGGTVPPQLQAQVYKKIGYTPGTSPSARAGTAPTLAQFQTSAGGQPQSTQNITLAPAQQQLLDNQTQQSIDLSNLASQLQAGVGASLSQPQTTPADINALSQQASNAYYNQEKAYLDPQFTTSQAQLDSSLANKGIMAGSDGYNQAQDEQNRNKSFAYNNAQQQAITAGPQNAQSLFGLSTAARDQPLTEFNALRTGSQPQQSNFSSVNPVSVNPTSVAQNIYSSYGANQNNYNQQVASNNSTTNGFFGLGGSALQGYGQYAGLAKAASIAAL